MTNTIKLTTILKEKQYPNFYLMEAVTGSKTPQKAPTSLKGFPEERSSEGYFFACYNPFTGWLRAGVSQHKRAFGKNKNPYNVFEENIGTGRTFYINSLLKILEGRVEYVG